MTRASLLRWLLGIAAIVILWWGGMQIVQQVIIDRMPMVDTIPIYVGCSYFYAGESPYTDDVMFDIQTTIGEDDADFANRQRFAYPAQMCVLLSPLWLLPFNIASASWILLNFLGLITLPLLLSRIWRWRLSPLKLILLTFMVFPGLRLALTVVVLGQYTGLMLFGLVGAAWALSRERQGLAAACLLPLIIRVDGGFIAVAMLLIAWWFGQRCVVLYWLAGVAATLALTVAVLGSWGSGYLFVVQDYSNYNPFFDWYLVKWGIVVGALVFAGCLGFIAAMIRWTRDMPLSSRIWWAAGTVAVVCLLIVPQTAQYTLVEVLLPYLLALYGLRHRRAFWVLLPLPLLTWLLLFSPLLDVVPFVIPVGVAIALLWAVRQGQPTIRYLSARQRAIAHD